MLGPEHFNALDKADEIGSLLDGLGKVLICGAIAICLVGGWLSLNREREAS